MINSMCDGSGPCNMGEVRVLPTGGDSNAILCRGCYERELDYRRERNRDLEAFAQFKLPTWESLAVYGERTKDHDALEELVEAEAEACRQETYNEIEGKQP